MFSLRTWAAAALLASRAQAYIPAVGVNDTSSLINSDDLIHIAWLPNGIFSAGLSRQLVADPVEASGNLTNVTNVTNVANWTKFSKGVLIHFSEQNATQPPSTVPWIAMINCDTNGTEGTFSMVDDIFTLSRDHGAQAALLFSLTSQGCLMNKEYLDEFEKPIDVYATTSLQAARTLDSQFSNVGASAYHYNSQMLNDSAAIIETLLAGDSLAVVGLPAVPISTISIDGPTSTSTDSIEEPTSTDSTTEVSTETSTTPDPSSTSSSEETLASTDLAQATASSTELAATARLFRRQATTSSAPATSTTKGANYLAAVMAARNVTVGQTSTPSQTAARDNSGPNTGLAMIILYAITGVVTAMFLVVILGGAVRAIRHPERYGPRASQGNQGGAGGGAGQSRTRGLTRAILDTFPVVKFGRTTENSEDEATRRRDEEGVAGKDVELHDVSTPVVVVPRATGANEDSQRSGEAVDTPSPATAETSDHPPTTSSPSDEDLSGPAVPLTINPADVDHGTTCPICVCEFEDGEDVRILPCDARHQFHRDCIDPWLLQVSSLCPLCRLDLSAGKEEPVPTAEEEEAAGEERVISNLRQMWQDRRGSTSGVGRHARESTNGTNGTSVSRNRFFRYVASRRQAGGGGEAPATVT